MEELDQADWRRYCEGDETSFARLYRRHKDHLLTYSVYAGHAREVGEDIVQEVFASLLRQKGNGTQIGSIKGWLFICARNASLNLLKRQKRDSGNPAVPDIATAEMANTPEIQRFLQTVLMRLEPDERELILLREYHGFSTGELATMLGLTEEAVRVRLYRVRKRMHELGKEYR